MGLSPPFPNDLTNYLIICKFAVSEKKLTAPAGVHGELGVNALLAFLVVVVRPVLVDTATEGDAHATGICNAVGLALAEKHLQVQQAADLYAAWEEADRTGATNIKTDDASGEEALTLPVAIAAGSVADWVLKYAP